MSYNNHIVSIEPKGGGVVKTKGKRAYHIVGKYILIIFCMAVILSGCGRVEPEKRAFAQVVSVDYVHDNYRVTLGLPNLKVATGQSKEEVSQKEEELPNVYEGQTLEMVEGIYEDQENKHLDLGHVQVLILGNGLLEDTKAYQYLLEKMEQDNLLCESVYVLKSDELDQVMKLNGTKIDSLGEYLEDMIEKNELEKTKLEDLYYAWHEKQQIPEIAVVSCLNNSKIVVKE